MQKENKTKQKQFKDLSTRIVKFAWNSIIVKLFFNEGAGEFLLRRKRVYHFAVHLGNRCHLVAILKTATLVLHPTRVTATVAFFPKAC